MKKVMMSSLFIAAAVLFSCEKEEVKTNVESSKDVTSNSTDFGQEKMVQSLSELQDKNTVLNTTDRVSDIFFQMGVSQIYVEESSQGIIYSFEANKSFGIGGEDVDLSNKTITFNGTELFMESNENTKVSIIDGAPHISTPDYEGPFENINGEQVTANIQILMLFLHEITTTSEFKNTFEDALSEYEEINSAMAGGGCGFWNTYYVYSVGASQSVAQAGLPGEIASADVGGCSTIGGVDTSCLVDNHFCASTQAFCC